MPGYLLRLSYFFIFPSLGVIPYNNRTLSELRVSDCAIKFEMVNI